MKMKNVLMILISLAVVFAMVGVVSAEFSDDKDSTIVMYNVEDSYIITVPVDVTILANLVSTDNQVNATSVLINDGKTLQVNLTSGNYWKEGIYNLTYHDSKIPYYINKTTSEVTPVTTPVGNGEVILSVPAGKPHPILKAFGTGTASIGDYVNLTFQTTENFISYATKSGLHQDTLTFQCEVIDTP